MDLEEPDSPFGYWYDGGPNADDSLPRLDDISFPGAPAGVRSARPSADKKSPTKKKKDENAWKDPKERPSRTDDWPTAWPRARSAERREKRYFEWATRTPLRIEPAWFQELKDTLFSIGQAQHARYVEEYYSRMSLNSSKTK